MSRRSRPRTRGTYRSPWLVWPLLGAALCGAPSCGEPETATPVQPHRFFAHRGMNAFAPENTLLAIRLALERGFTNVEIDVRTTRDDAIMVFHDEGLQRWTGMPRTVCDVSREELQAVDPAPFYLREILRIPAEVVSQVQHAGDPWVAQLAAAHIATLEEVFATFGPRLTYHLDVKRFGCTVSRPVMLARLVALIERFDLTRHVYVESTDVSVLTMVRAMNPAIRLLYWRDDVFDASDDDLGLIRALGIEAVDVASHRVVPAKRPRLAGLEVFTFTVNSVAQITQLAGVVDFILTDLDAASGELLDPATFFNLRAERVWIQPGAAPPPSDAAARGFVPLSQHPLVLVHRPTGRRAEGSRDHEGGDPEVP